MTDIDTLERRLGRVLGAGSLVSTLLFGLALVVLFGGRHAWSEALVQAGLMILFGTPFARVIVTIATYWRDRDWMFVAMTSAVLLVLIGSVIVAMR